ncbi:hypothetical protein Hanom_Chr16g01442901 [Helianthus anomalus]
MADSPSHCMENPTVANPIFFEEHVQDQEEAGEQEQQPFLFNDEREDNEVRTDEALGEREYGPP